jgi:hypothetical protein
MMGVHQPQEQLFSYRVNLEHRMRPDHPLRRVAQVIDFTFVRVEVARFYGKNGNEGVDPIILVKLMFLLFWDDVPSGTRTVGTFARAPGLPLVPGLRPRRADPQPQRALQGSPPLGA